MHDLAGLGLLFGNQTLATCYHISARNRRVPIIWAVFETKLAFSPVLMV